VVVILKGRKDINKPIRIQEHSLFMGRADLKVQKLQAYKIERKRSTKRYTELSKRLLSILVHNAFCFTDKAKM
jgi:hypothetical protein